MTSSSAHDSPTSARAGASGPEYSERLSVPLSWYLFAVIISAIFAAQAHLLMHEVSIWVPLAVITPLVLLATWRLGRTPVSVRDGVLRVRHASIPVAQTGAAAALDAGALRKLAGRFGDPAAFVMLRPWVGPGVQLLVNDPDDPTPYWLFSARHAQDLIDAIEAAKAAAH